MNPIPVLSFEPAVVNLFPEDIAHWIDLGTLVALAREAAKTFCWIGADDDDPSPFGGAQCPLRKLTLLTCAYARGIYSSQDVESLSLESGAIRELCAGAHFTAEKLRLFRGQNSELLRLALAFVLKRAWQLRFGEGECSRNLFLAEAAARVQRAIFADRVMAAASSNRSSRGEEAHSFTPHVLRITEDQSLVTSTATRNSFVAAAIVLLALLLLLLPARAGETLPPFAYQGKTYTNAVVIKANPVNVLIRQEEQGFKRLKRQEMPAELKDRFPYDAKEVEEYEKQQTAKAKARRDQARAEAYAALLRQEQTLLAQINRVESDLLALQKEINVRKSQAHGRPRSAERQAVIQCQERKIALERYLENLRRHLEAVHAQQVHYR